MSTGESFCPSSHVLGSGGPTAHVVSEVCMKHGETEGDVSTSSGLSFTSLPVWFGLQLFGIRIWPCFKFNRSQLCEEAIPSEAVPSFQL